MAKSNVKRTYSAGDLSSISFVSFVFVDHETEPKCFDGYLVKEMRKPRRRKGVAKTTAPKTCIVVSTSTVLQYRRSGALSSFKNHIWRSNANSVGGRMATRGRNSCANIHVNTRYPREVPTQQSYCIFLQWQKEKRVSKDITCEETNLNQPGIPEVWAM